jgi:hypothetical protein
VHFVLLDREWLGLRQDLFALGREIVGIQPLARKRKDKVGLGGRCRIKKSVWYRER